MISFLKKSFLSVLVLSSFSLHGSVIQQEGYNEQEIQVIESVQEEPLDVKTSEPTPWYKQGMFWFGCLNGFYLPVSYAIALGFDLVDTSHPAVKEKLKPFGYGAATGIGVRAVYEACRAVLVAALVYKIATNIGPQEPAPQYLEAE